MLNDKVKNIVCPLKFFCLRHVFRVHAVYKGFKRRPSDTFSCFQKKVNTTIVLLQELLQWNGLIMKLVYIELFVLFNEEF